MAHGDLSRKLERALEHFSDPATRRSYFEIYDPECVLHGYPGVAPGKAGIEAFYEAFWQAFPDVTIAADDVLEEGDRVACRFTFRATHRGPFQGIPPTGKRVEGTGITILKFRAGRCVERWSSTDFLGLLQQLGAAPAA
jgi:predicted ester cyclase